MPASTWGSCKLTAIYVHQWQEEGFGKGWHMPAVGRQAGAISQIRIKTFVLWNPPVCRPRAECSTCHTLGRKGAYPLRTGAVHTAKCWTKYMDVTFNTRVNGTVRWPIVCVRSSNGFWERCLQKVSYREETGKDCREMRLGPGLKSW